MGTIEPKALPSTSTERLLAIADLLEKNPDLWQQSVWVKGIEDVSDAVGRGVCDTPGCIAGEGVMLSPPELLAGITDWHQAGAVALGLTDELASTMFAGDWEPERLPEVLRAVAGIREGNRTRSAFVKALRAADLLSSRVLSGANLSGAVLSRANLTGADLYGANLSRANLTGAVLSRANLTGANLSRADLYGADLSGADLSGADLSRANLSRADLTGADLTGADLTGADLSGANLSWARGDRFTRLPAGWVVDPDSGLVVKDGE